MTDAINHQWRLAARPVGLPKTSDWSFTSEAPPVPGPGQVLVRVLYLSLDPAMRGWMNEGKSYVPPVGIGEVMRALGVGRVVASNDPSIAVGDHVVGLMGAQDYAVLAAKEATRIEPSLAPLPTWLGVLGMPGMTAYFGLLDVGQPKPGETVVVSGAAGAVGGLVGQIAKLKGCRVIGIAGGADKCRYVVEDLGFDGAIDYKAEDVRKSLRALAPKGVDVYFDNVGGDILDTVLAQLARGARIAICGAISQYNSTEGVKGPANYMSLLVNRARMQGFVVFDYAARYAEAARDIAVWIAEGKVKAKEDVAVGLENFPATLLKLFKGENFGKLVLKLAD
ncbi:NADP-dependent oxidoreductase [Zavarzinia aquatilis]|uniref:NADP-dependent oxidoreductase n=1 Tax=Zavarzinia aquatilis TaxID=2211142 RepID=A0A317E4S7_9PROT|nr:NADP-dependent oxidoreductase [Zavarzinia aquatilis]PWR21176.1 NADP-dependent oxidoreductase [Zavarzinia aquatilis]